MHALSVLSHGQAIQGEVRLHEQKHATSGLFTTVIAEVEASMTHRLPKPWTHQSCHEVYEAAFQAENAQQAIAMVYNRVLFPFVDVLCVFLDDLGGVQGTCEKLASWYMEFCPSTSPVRPALILVTTVDAEQTFESFWKLVGPEIHEMFSGVKCVAISERRQLRRGRYSRSLAWGPLKQAIKTSQLAIFQARSAAGFQLSTVHVDAFIKLITRNLMTKALDFVMLSRAADPIPSDLAQSLSKFCRHFPADIQCFAVPVIASALIMNYYRPGTHCKPVRSPHGLATNPNSIPGAHDISKSVFRCMRAYFARAYLPKWACGVKYNAREPPRSHRR